MEQAAKQYLTPEQRRLAKEFSYHLACMTQYHDSAERLTPFPKLRQRALDNALFHKRHIDALAFVAAA